MIGTSLRNRREAPVMEFSRVRKKRPKCHLKIQQDVYEGDMVFSTDDDEPSSGTEGELESRRIKFIEYRSKRLRRYFILCTTR